ncbi:DUF456 domain-containing protein [Streptomyces sp. URMC 123]|uniref:DUF456 domain-containing protein n=1 Tax=Streptomyces sp. URMC 123 TaxID=3423403 RepID=UPI003F1C561F
MGTWQLVAIGTVMLLGLLGVLVPGLPGPPVVWAGVLWWSMAERSGAAWWVLIGATGALLFHQALKRLLPARRPSDAGVSWRTLFVAGLVGIAGFAVVPVIGCPLGFVGGLYARERARLGARGEAWLSTRVALRAAGLSMLVELLFCLLVVGAWVGAVLSG